MDKKLAFQLHLQLQPFVEPHQARAFNGHLLNWVETHLQT